MKILVRLALGTTLAAAPALIAQTPTTQQPAETATQHPKYNLPAFEVATIKPIDPNKGTMIGANVLPGARVVINGMSLRGLIMVAFKLQPWQIKGGESWVDHTRYDVEALPSEEMRLRITDLRHELFGIDDPTLRQMLQARLIDRFQLRFHTETRAGSVFLLEKSGKTLRLQPTKARPGGPASPYSSGELGAVGGRWSIYDSSMPEFAQMAGWLLQRPVLDRTGLNGAFDYKSSVINDPTTQTEDPTGSLVQLISEMGLKLESAKGPVETFVIDHAESPTSN